MNDMIRLVAWFNRMGEYQIADDVISDYWMRY